MKLRLDNQITESRSEVLLRQIFLLKMMRICVVSYADISTDLNISNLDFSDHALFKSRKQVLE